MEGGRRPRPPWMAFPPSGSRSDSTSMDIDGEVPKQQSETTFVGWKFLRGDRRRGAGHAE